LLSANPIDPAEKIPSPGESDHGQASDKDQIATLVQHFRGYSLYPIVAVAAYTGARRNEILALQWRDLDLVAKTLRIERALEETKGEPRQGPVRILKGPKKDSHKRTIAIDDSLVALLLSVKERHLRLAAGVSDGAVVDLSLKWRFHEVEGCQVTNEFEAHARKLFPKLRFHDMRGSHETALLDAGVPVHTVASRCGHDPATLLRSYAKQTKKADTSAAAVIASMSKGEL